MKSAVFFLAISLLAGQAQAGAGLVVLVKRGEGSKARAGEPSPNRIEVLVSDSAGNPVPDATVTFTLPREGATGRFASGLTSESVITSGDGTASVAGISWGESPGAVLLQIKASRNGETGSAVVTVDLAPAGGGRSTASRGAGKSKWILAAAAAGAALAGLAFAGGNAGAAGPGAPAQPPALAAPTVGAPVVSIGKP